MALLVGPGQVVEIPGRALISARDVYQVAKVYRALRCGRRSTDDDIADLLWLREFSRGIDLNTLRPHLELPAGQRDVARAEDVFQLGRRHAVSGKALLGVVEVDLFRKHSFAIDLGYFRSTLHGPSHQVGVVIEFAIGIFVARDRSQTALRFLGITNEGGRPTIRVNF